MIDGLLQVRKPARYIGNEWNVSKKPFENADVKFALCFPDLYEVGMSNLGIRIIYGILNSITGVVCERFFSPAQDLEDMLRSNKMEIFSLESKRRLREFDIAGFSMGYELSYTNILSLLDLGSVPLKSSMRDASWPLVIGGGPCTANPEPVHEFFDLFVIGEAEDAIGEIIEVYKNTKPGFKSGRIPKQELLLLLSGIEGVYVPSLYEVKYDQAGSVAEFKPKYDSVPVQVKKRFVRDFNNSFFPVEWIVPYIEVIHDRIAVEIMRSCPNTCRFCQAKRFYYPLRQRDVGTILKLADSAYKNTGYEEIALAGLSVSDYSCLGELLGKLVDLFKDNGVSISLPSVKPRTYLGDFTSLVATIKKTGLTFAPEAAREETRKMLGKNFDLQAFFQALEKSYLSGYQRVKLYFMISLPHENENDLDAILDLAEKVSCLRKTKNLPAAFVNVSINPLIPKPHTPFQWLGMESPGLIKNKINYIKAKNKNRKIKLNFHNPDMSFLEALLSRGDRRLSKIIESAFNKGARFDAWDDHFDLARWMDAFSESKLDPESYLKEKPKDQALPWDFIDIGVKKEELAAEYDKIV